MPDRLFGGANIGGEGVAAAVVAELRLHLCRRDSVGDAVVNLGQHGPPGVDVHSGADGAEADALCGVLRPAQRRAPQLPRRVWAPRLRHPCRHDRCGHSQAAAGSYFPDCLLERPKRAERALTSVVATCYLLEVSTHRVRKLVKTLGITWLSKSQVSVMAKELDTAVDAFRTRPLDAGPNRFVGADGGGGQGA
jgi:hypothetical protein